LCGFADGSKWWSRARAAGGARGWQNRKWNLEETSIAHNFNGFYAQSTSQIAVKSQSKSMICQQIQEDDHVVLQ